jgi:hypothetical protein
MRRDGRRIFTYSNVVATLALFFALTGAAVAATHYLITSTRQIKPSVLKGIEGQPGPATTVLAKGQTLRGTFGFVGNALDNSGDIDAVSFGLHLTSAPTVVIVPPATTGTGPCAGGTVLAPKAKNGYLCVFEDTLVNGSLHVDPTVGADGGTKNASPFGFIAAAAPTTASGLVAAFGSWAVTG